MSASYERMVGLRYIRSRSSNRFISFISLISMLGIAVGVAVLIVVLSVMNGFERELRERILNLTSHAAVQAITGGLPDWRLAREQSVAFAGVADAAPFIEGEGMLVKGEAVSGVLVRGVLPEEESRVSSLAEKMVAGRLADLAAGEYGIVLGKVLAEELGVGLGDKVVLAVARGTVTPAGLVPRVRRFTVAGVFEAGMYEFDRGLAYVHMADADRLYATRGEVSGLRLRLEDMFEAPTLVREVARGLGGGLWITDWTRQHANFFRSIQLTKQMMFVILLLVVAVAAFNIVSTLVMVVRDKQSDIAILRTMGSSPWSILSVFTIQGTVIGLLGVLGGVLLGVTIAVNTETLVHWLEAALDTQFLAASVYFMTDLPAEVRWPDVAKISGTAFLLAVASTLYPAWRAARTRPAEALRHE